MRILMLVSEPASGDVLCTNPQGERNWLEEGIVDAATERFALPVRHFEIS